MKMGILYIIAGTLLIIGGVFILKLDKEKEEIVKPSETKIIYETMIGEKTIYNDVKLVKATGHQSAYPNQSGSSNIAIGLQSTGAQAGN